MLRRMDSGLALTRARNDVHGASTHLRVRKRFRFWSRFVVEERIGTDSAALMRM
jgi:hypothetical protein